jgi:hypothetical protein
MQNSSHRATNILRAVVLGRLAAAGGGCKVEEKDGTHAVTASGPRGGKDASRAAGAGVFARAVLPPAAPFRDEEGNPAPPPPPQRLGLRQQPEERGLSLLPMTASETVVDQAAVSVATAVRGGSGPHTPPLNSFFAAVAAACEATGPCDVLQLLHGVAGVLRSTDSRMQGRFRKLSKLEGALDPSSPPAAFEALQRGDVSALSGLLWQDVPPTGLLVTHATAIAIGRPIVVAELSPNPSASGPLLTSSHLCATPPGGGLGPTLFLRRRSNNEYCVSGEEDASVVERTRALLERVASLEQERGAQSAAAVVAKEVAEKAVAAAAREAIFLREKLADEEERSSSSSASASAASAAAAAAASDTERLLVERVAADGRLAALSREVDVLRETLAASRIEAAAARREATAEKARAMSGAAAASGAASAEALGLEAVAPAGHMPPASRALYDAARAASSLPLPPPSTPSLGLLAAVEAARVPATAPLPQVVVSRYAPGPSPPACAAAAEAMVVSSPPPQPSVGPSDTALADSTKRVARLEHEVLRLRTAIDELCLRFDERHVRFKRIVRKLMRKNAEYRDDELTAMTLFAGERGMRRMLYRGHRRVVSAPQLQDAHSPRVRTLVLSTDDICWRDCSHLSSLMKE